MPILFLVVLLDAAGFGIIIPVFLYYALQLGAAPEQATMFFSIYPIAIILSSPLLGRLSDRMGRKPVLLVTLLLACGGYLLLGLAHSLWMLALARFVQGAMAGNMSVVQAYVADISDDAGRAKAMGKIGAATALGFVIGPAVGAWLGGSNFANTQLEVAAYVSAASLLIAFIAVLFLLPESLSAEQQAKSRELPFRFNPFAYVPKALATPLLREFILCAFLFNIAGAFAEVILPLWLKDNALINGPSGLTYMFLCAGLVLAFTQARLIAPVAKRFGENLMLRFGALGYGSGFILITLMGAMNFYPGVIAAWCISGASMAFFFTGLQSLASKCAAPHERGQVMGAFSAVGTIGRVIGPALTGLLYVNLHANAPFYLGALLLLGVVLVSVKLGKPLEN
jgi:DHA1 family tetracycline resistance protein-like MFS transporter